MEAVIANNGPCRILFIARKNQITGISQSCSDFGQLGLFLITEVSLFNDVCICGFQESRSHKPESFNKRGTDSSSQIRGIPRNSKNWNIGIVEQVLVQKPVERQHVELVLVREPVEQPQVELALVRETMCLEQVELDWVLGPVEQHQVELVLVRETMCLEQVELDWVLGQVELVLVRGREPRRRCPPFVEASLECHQRQLVSWERCLQADQLAVRLPAVAVVQLRVRNPQSRFGRGTGS